MMIGYSCRHRSIADRTAGDFDGPDFQCFFVGTKRNFAPYPLFCAVMLARMLLALTLLLDAVAINQEVQWYLRPVNVHCKGLLAAAQGDRWAYLDGCSAVGLLAATPPRRRGFPLHL